MTIRHLSAALTANPIPLPPLPHLPPRVGPARKRPLLICSAELETAPAPMQLAVFEPGPLCVVPIQIRFPK